MDGFEKAALFLSGLDFAAADQVLSRLDSAAARQIRRTMISLKHIPYSGTETEQLDKEFLQSAGWQPAPNVRSLRTHSEHQLATPKPAATYHAPPRQPMRYGTEAFIPVNRPFEFLRHWTAAEIIAATVGEHPQTMAVILAHLPKSKMNAVLSALPPGLQAEIVKRLRTFEMPDETVLGEIESALQARQQTRKNARQSHPQTAETAEIIETFEDLEMLDNAGLSALFHAVDLRLVMLSLVGSEPSFVNRVIRRFSPAEEQEMRKYLKQMRCVDAEDIEQARQKILEVYRAVHCV